jgi:molecular chaperone GrpE
VAPDKGPSQDAVRGQLREEREQVADSSAAHDGDSVADVRDKEQEDPVAKVEAARSAEARMATESASAVESADAAGRGSDPDQGQTDRGDAAAVKPGTAAADAEAEAELAAEPDNGDADHLRAERDRYLDLAKRTQADFDNYRKRAAKDAAAAGARAKSGLVRELLPVVDNLERALQSASESDEAIAQGVRLVHADLVGLLERNGIESQEPSGERFDPTEHEAVSMRSEEGAEAGIVLDVVEKGYKLGDMVIRPARVVVSG